MLFPYVYTYVPGICQFTCCISLFLLTVDVLVTTHPQDELANVSDSVNFACEASGSSPIYYRWLYNGNYIMNDPGHIEGINTTTLMIVNVTVTDWGMYSCEANNIVNNDTSNEATLHGEGYLIHSYNNWVLINTYIRTTDNNVHDQ